MSILQTEFDFPRKKLSEMTEAEKEQLALDIARHHQTGVGPSSRPVELEPSKVLDPQSPEARALYDRKKQRTEIVYTHGMAGNGRFRFDPKLGYIVPGEDPAVVTEKVSDINDLDRILQPGPRSPNANELYDHEMSQMDTPDRDAEERFSGI